jgi:tRNA1Val (adenine37-N6)-methyltransferase
VSENGIFSVIIPFKEEESFLAIANEYNYIHKNHSCKGTPTLKSSVLAFTRKETNDFPFDELIIELQDINIPQVHYVDWNFI